METKKIKVLFNNIKDNSNSQLQPKTYDIGVYEVPVEVADHLLERDIATTDIVVENKKITLKYKNKNKNKK